MRATKPRLDTSPTPCLAGGARLPTLIPSLRIVAIQERLAGEIALQVLGEKVGRPIVVDPRSTRDVRREDHVGHLPQRAALGKRLHGIDIESGARQPVVLQRFDQGPMIHHTTARNIDQKGRLLHALQDVGVDHAPRLRRQWDGHHDEVAKRDHRTNSLGRIEAINDLCWRHLPRYAEAHPWRGLAYRSLLLEWLFPLPIDDLEPLLMETLETLGSIARACRERGIGYLAGSFAAPDPRRTSEEFRRHLDVNTESWTRRFPLRSYETYAAILERYNRRFVDFARRDHHSHVLVHEELSDPDLFIDVCHFTPEGIERLAEVFLPAVEELVRDTPEYRRWTEAAEAGPDRRRH